MNTRRLGAAVEGVRLSKVALDDAREALRRARKRFNEAMAVFMRESLKDATLKLARRGC